MIAKVFSTLYFAELNDKYLIDSQKIIPFNIR